jgi:hypothetical protein
MISAEMVDHLTPEVMKEPLAPFHVLIFMLVNDPKNANYLLLNLHLMALQLWSSGSLPLRRGINVFRDVLHVVIFVKNIPDAREAGLQYGKRVAVTILDDSDDIDFAFLQPIGDALDSKRLV